MGKRQNQHWAKPLLHLILLLHYLAQGFLNYSLSNSLWLKEIHWKCICFSFKHRTSLLLCSHQQNLSSWKYKAALLQDSSRKKIPSSSSPRKMWEFSILLAATCALAAPAHPLHFCHLQVLLFCILPRGGGSPLLPLLLTTDSSSHGNHQFSPGMSSSTYTAKRNATKQVSIRKQTKKAQGTVSQIRQTQKKMMLQKSAFPSLPGVIHVAFTL